VLEKRGDKEDNTEGGLVKRNWKQGLSSKQIIIYNG